jgi:predicted small secreted protein
MHKLRSCLLFAAIITAVACLAACNTVEGLGKDTKNLGRKIEDAAVRSK